MKNLKQEFLSLRVLGTGVLAALALNGCAAGSDPQLTAPPERYTKIEQGAPGVKSVDVTAKVDIIFVIDNSDSMQRHQDNLKANIGRFVEAFEADKTVDFHIGVVSIFDSKRYGSVVKSFYPLGQLQPLKDPANPGKPVPGPQYITRESGYAAILGESLDIGVIPLRDKATGQDIGPEYEESFSPVIAAIDGRNSGFIRADAHLAIVFLTDGDDDSTVSPSEMKYRLIEAKGGDANAQKMFSAYAVLSPDKRLCPQDPGGPPTKITEFLNLVQGSQFNLCDRHFGDKLAAVGREIEQKATPSTVRIRLATTPEFPTLVVTYGGVPVPMNDTTGWSYDPDMLTIIVNGTQKLAQAAGVNDSEIRVSYTAVDGRKFGTANVVQVGTAAPVTSAH